MTWRGIGGRPRDAWSAEHPSAMSRIRKVEARLASVEPPIRQTHARMRSFFKWGRAVYGQRI